MLNHFVSELGEVAHSELAWVFNSSLIVGGALVTVYMLGLALCLHGWFRWVFGIAGLVTGVSGALVGCFPMDDLGPHFRVAMTYFNGGMATAVLFSIYVLFFPQTMFPKWLALPGGVTALCFFSLLYLTEPMMPEGEPLEMVRVMLAQRPPVWQTAIIEWAVILSVLVWVLTVSVYLWLKARRNETQK